jgi:hypothetical protein
MSISAPGSPGPQRRARSTAVVRVLVLSLVAAAALPTGAFASRARLVNLEEMSQRADRILSGTCVAMRLERDTALNIDTTIVTIEVKRVVKGRRERSLTLRLAGDATGSASGTNFVGMPQFKVGEEVVLFLYGESRAGLTSPVGFGQGKFTVETHKDGMRYATNGRANQDLLRNLSPEGSRRLDEARHGHEHAADPAWGREDTMRVEALLELAAALSR